MTLADALTPAERRLLVAWLVEVARDLGGACRAAPLPGLSWREALAQAGEADADTAATIAARARDLVETYRDPGVPDVTWRDVLREAGDLAAWAQVPGVAPESVERARVLALASRTAPDAVEAIACNALRRLRGQPVARWTEWPATEARRAVMA